MKSIVLKVFLLGVIMSSVFVTTASAGTWNVVGSDSYVGAGEISKVVYSTGGDFRVCLATGSKSSASIILYEQDPGYGDINDVVVQPALISQAKRLTPTSPCAIWRDINKYVDGDNGKAEFYIKAFKFTSPPSVVFYD